MLADALKVCFHFGMKRSDAVELFDSVSGLAEALGITPQAIYQWPDELDQERADRVMGAAMRLGKIPQHDLTTRVA